MKTNEIAPELRREPDVRAARLRQDFDQAHELPEDGLTLADLLVESARCEICTFRDLDKTCRVWPPRPLQDGRPVWPLVLDSHWCGLWAAR